MLRFFLLLLPVMVFSQSLPSQLEAVLNEQYKPNEPGVAVLVMDGGKVIFRKGFGLGYVQKPMVITPKTTFRMASVSKQFTAMAILLLEKQGKLRLSDALSTFFPELPAWSRNINLQHMITHTSGIVDGEGLLTEESGNILAENAAVKRQLQADYQGLRQIADKDHLLLLQKVDTTYFRPGTQFRYSNSAFCLLALVVEKVSGLSYARFLDKFVFKPLGMKNARVFSPPSVIPQRSYGYAQNQAGKWFFKDQSQTSATLGDGGVYLSIDDYAIWYRALRNNSLIDLVWVHKTLFSMASDEHKYGAGWFFDDQVLFHSGTTCGFSNFVVAIPASGKLIAWFSNRANDHAAFGKIQRLLVEQGFFKQDVWKWHEQTQ